MVSQSRSNAAPRPGSKFVSRSAGQGTRSYDVFNGDADGICALIQLRQLAPSSAELITGVKRDIALLARIDPATAASVTVLDVSLDKNRAALVGLLNAGCAVFYCDHHFAGEVPAHPALDSLINTGSDVCTSLLVNGRLQGARADWAIVGAFGDNLDASALAVARTLELRAPTLDLYKRLGTYVNYNGYGSTLDDLYFHPAELYELMCGYPKPAAFVAEARSSFERLEQGYEDDMSHAQAMQPEWQNEQATVIVLPDEAWSRRVSGVYGNALANRAPSRAHAVLTQKSDGGFLVSVRAPLSDKRDADTLCRAFATGGGRAAAAGINDLPAGDLDRFVAELANTYSAR